MRKNERSAIPNKQKSKMQYFAECGWWIFKDKSVKLVDVVEQGPFVAGKDFIILKPYDLRPLFKNAICVGKCPKGKWVCLLKVFDDSWVYPVWLLGKERKSGGFKALEPMFHLRKLDIIHTIQISSVPFRYGSNETIAARDFEFEYTHETKFVIKRNGTNDKKPMNYQSAEICVSFGWRTKLPYREWGNMTRIPDSLAMSIFEETNIKVRYIVASPYPNPMIMAGVRRTGKREIENDNFWYLKRTKRNAVSFDKFLYWANGGKIKQFPGPRKMNYSSLSIFPESCPQGEGERHFKMKKALTEFLREINGKNDTLVAYENHILKDHNGVFMEFPLILSKTDRRFISPSSPQFPRNDQGDACMIKSGYYRVDVALCQDQEVSIVFEIRVSSAIDNLKRGYLRDNRQTWIEIRNMNIMENSLELNLVENLSKNLPEYEIFSLPKNWEIRNGILTIPKSPIIF